MRLSESDIKNIKQSFRYKTIYTQKYVKLLESAERARVCAKEYTHQSLADKYGVSKARIQHIKEAMG